MRQTRKTGSRERHILKACLTDKMQGLESFGLELESGLCHLRAVCEFKQMHNLRLLHTLRMRVAIAEMMGMKWDSRCNHLTLCRGAQATLELWPQALEGLTTWLCGCHCIYVITVTTIRQTRQIVPINFFLWISGTLLLYLIVFLLAKRNSYK